MLVSSSIGIEDASVPDSEAVAPPMEQPVRARVAARPRPANLAVVRISFLLRIRCIFQLTLD
jgi:hypothetical protein